MKLQVTYGIMMRVTTLKRIAGYLWFPWLIALYPVLFLFERNMALVRPEGFFAALGVAAVGVTLVAGLAWLILRSFEKSAAIAAVVAILFFSAGHIGNLVKADPMIFSLIAPVWAALAALGVLAIVRWLPDSLIRRAAPALNLVFLVLSLFPAAQAVRFFGANVLGPGSAQAASRAVAPVLNDATHPDIYYIILDAYPANKHLERDWGYDNTAFTRALEERGLVVAYDSTSNYSVTLPSLAATLNMRYVSEGEQPSSDPTGVDYGRDLIADNAVARELQANGYTYVFMLSGWDSPSTIADINIDFYESGARRFAPGELKSDDSATRESFMLALAPTTWLGTTPAAGWLETQLATPPTGDTALWFLDPKRAQLTWQETPRIAAMPEATFTFAHLIKPHGPVIFDRSGKVIPPPSDGDLEAYAPYFFDELAFVNDRTLKMIDEILANSSQPPIIIIQSDHGSYLGLPGDLEGDKPYFEILNAFYFPDGGNREVYQSISSVNTFRLMFNTYFGGNYEMLPDDRHFFTVDRYKNLFHFVEVDLPQ